MTTTLPRRISWVCAGLVLALLGVAGWAAWAPLPALPRERILVIPRGTGTDAPPIFPSRIHMTVGLQDILVLQNDDDEPQLVAGMQVPARSRLTIPFQRPADIELTCSVHPSGRLAVLVREPPPPGWARLRWRVVRWLE